MRQERDEGFSFLEIMVVVIIIGLLTTLIGTNIIGRFGQAKATIAEAKLRKLGTQLELYRMDNNRYPTNEQGLEALVIEPQSEPRPKRYPPGGYSKRDDLVDPWSNPVQYTMPGTHNTHSYDLVSLGADGVEGGEGENADLGNWEDPAAR